MLDYQKNPHADSLLRELGNAEPRFLAKFSVEKLLNIEACNSALLQVLKTYIEKRKLVDSSEETISLLVETPQTQKLVSDFCAPTCVLVENNRFSFVSQKRQLSERSRSI